MIPVLQGGQCSDRLPYLLRLNGKGVDSVGKIQLGPVQLIDGGDGETFPRFAAAYPQAVATVLRSLAETTGVDVTSLLAPVATGGGGGTAPPGSVPAPGGVR